MRGSFPPPLSSENPFSLLGRRRILLLFSKVIADGLLSTGRAVDPEMVLSPPTFSKAVA